MDCRNDDPKSVVVSHREVKHLLLISSTLYKNIIEKSIHVNRFENIFAWILSNVNNPTRISTIKKILRVWSAFRYM